MGLRKTIKKKLLNLFNRKKYKKVLIKEKDILSKKPSKSLVVFMLPDNDVIGGGVMSINTIYEASKSMKDVHNSEVLASKYPFDKANPTFVKFTKFENNMDIFHFESIVKSYSGLNSIILNLPEYIIPAFIDSYKYWDNFTKNWWINIKNRHINIMNQNILLMPKKEYIEKLRNISTKLTQTTAHDRYGTKEIEDKFNVKLHHLSVKSNFDKINNISLYDKKKIIMLSPDDKTKNKDIIDLVSKELPDFECKVVKNLTYKQYLQLSKDAMFSISFGEGLDGYFSEPFRCGGVSFAIYNNDFFLKELKEFPTIFPSYENLLECLVGDIKKYSTNFEIYKEINNQYNDIIEQYYSDEMFFENLKNFYLGKYQFSNRD